MNTPEFWTPTGLILGFQMTLFAWRLKRESEVGDEGDIPWLTPSDYMNIVGMLVLVMGVYLLPIMHVISIRTSIVLFGLGMLLFIGQALGTAGHYQLFNRKKLRKFVWFPWQEKIVLLAATLISIIYLFVAFRSFK